MVRATWLVLMMVGGCMSEAEMIDETASASCEPRNDEIRGCCAAGASCTWFAPIGERCTDEFNAFCGRGLGWCEDSVCREFCNPVATPRCEDGLMEQHSTSDELGDSDRCLCVPR